jgi:SAM-dependent methyltransferase
MAEKQAYCQAAGTGKYEKPSGLLGKYDNVRRFWEDRLTAELLAPAVNELVSIRKGSGKGLRILDIGCGSGDGYELLTGVPTGDSGVCATETSAMADDALDGYVGLDINEDLLDQARCCHGSNPKTDFIQGDLSDGLPEQINDLQPFDLYFAGYGTLSHFKDRQTAKILADICAHASNGAAFVGDWLGRYSYEWQDLWPESSDSEYFMDYRISYLYSEEERPHVNVVSFPLRLMTRKEILAIVGLASALSGTQIIPLRFFDRSIFVGRHTETADYNRNCPRLRSAVSSLLEPYRRTDLENLRVNYVPKEGFDSLNDFFRSFFDSCNQLVDYTVSLLIDNDRPSSKSKPFRPIPESPIPLREAMETIRKTVEVTRGIDCCDARANFIEPMLAYSLRKLEMELQPSTGVGHGLVGVFTIKK